MLFSKKHAFFKKAIFSFVLQTKKILFSKRKIFVLQTKKLKLDGNRNIQQVVPMCFAVSVSNDFCSLIKLSKDGLDQSKDCCDVNRIIKQKPKFPEGDFSVGFDISAITPRNSTFMIHMMRLSDTIVLG